jgi:predicted dinucleotide-binding enzyme
MAGDIVVVSVPLKAYPHLPAQALAGKVVLDTGNYYPHRDGQITDLDNGSLTCSGLLQRYLPDAKVVKVFNNIFFKHLASLARPSGASDRTALPIAGDDEKAKATVTEFLDSIGYDTVDTGSLTESWRQDAGAPCYGAPYGSFSDEKGTPAGVGTIRTALAEAQR